MPYEREKPKENSCKNLVKKGREKPLTSAGLIMPPQENRFDEKHILNFFSMLGKQEIAGNATFSSKPQAQHINVNKARSE